MGKPNWKIEQNRREVTVCTRKRVDHAVEVGNTHVIFVKDEENYYTLLKQRNAQDVAEKDIGNVKDAEDEA